MKITNAMIDPQLRGIAKLLRVALPGGRTPERLARKTPAMISWLLTRRKPKHARQIEKWIPRPDGTLLRILILTPIDHATTQRPGILWIHGGGYAGGSPELEIAFLDHFAELTGAVIVTPDYRLSSEAPYPAALDDCYTTLLYLKEHAGELGVRDDQLAVGGASAGGGLTAAITLYARDRGDVQVAFQFPFYPMIDDRPRGSSSTDNDAPLWDGVTNQSAWKLYLGELFGTDDVPGYAAPARATDFSGLPPTLTYVGGIEPFRDETVAYVDALRAAGVDVTFREFPGAFHGFDAVAAKSGPAREARRFSDEWLTHAIASHFAPQKNATED